MANSLGLTRKAIAGVSTAALLASYAAVLPTASAASFTDVPADHWAADHISELADMGIVSGSTCTSGSGTCFRPNDGLNRAEMAKIAVNVAAQSGVIADPSDMTGAPTFIDVPTGTWFYEYVSVAAKNGIFEGFKDASGNLTGFFGPEQTVNRAQASKVLLLSAGVPEMLVPASPFIDVNPSDWFYNYVTSAYNWSILDGYKDNNGSLTGFFGPADDVTRAQIAKIATLAQDPVDRYTGEKFKDMDSGDDNTGDDNTGDDNTGDDNTGDDSGDDDTTTTPSNVSFEAELSASTPTGVTLATKTAYNTVAIIDLTAGTDEGVNVNKMDLVSRGFISDTAISGVLVIDEDGKRHGNIVTFSDDQATIDFGSNPIMVEAGTTAQIMVQLNFEGTSGGTVGIEIPAGGIHATGDTTGGDVDVMGTFPITGPLFDLVDGSSTVGAVSIDQVNVTTGAAVTVDLGDTNKEMSKFKLEETSAREDVLLTELTVYNNGNASDGDFENIRLLAPTGEVLATVAQSTAGYVTFDLSANPYEIAEGTSRNLSIMVDIAEGQNSATRTVQFLVENDYDIKIKGKSSGSFLLATASGTTDTTFSIGDAGTTPNTLQIDAGELTFSKDTSSPSGEIAAGGTDVVIGTWKVEAAGEDIEIRNGSFKIVQTRSGAEAAGAQPDCTAAGGDYFTDISKGTLKIKNSAGTTLHSVNLNTASNCGILNPVGTTASFSNTRFNNYVTIKGGTTDTLTMVVDFDEDAQQGDTVSARLGNLSIKKLTSNKTETVNPTLVAANTMSVTTAALTIAKNSSMGDQNLVRGSSSQKIGSFNITTTNAEGVNISSLILDADIYNNTDTAQSSVSGLNNLKLMVDGEQIGSTISTPAVANNTFSVSGQLNIAKASSVTVDVYADVSTTLGNGVTGAYLRLDMDTRASATSGDVTGTGLNSSKSVAGPVSGFSLQKNTLSDSGTATIATTSNTSKNATLASGETSVNLFSFSVQADNNEDLKLTRAQVAVGNGQETVTNLKLYDGTDMIAGPLTLTNGMVDFSAFSQDVVVTKNSTKTLWVGGDVIGSGSLDSDTEFIGGLYYYEVQGAASGTLVQRYAARELVGTDSAEAYAKGDVVFANDASGTGHLALVSTAGNGGTTPTAALDDGGALTLNAAGDLLTVIPTTGTETVANTSNPAGQYAVGEVVIATNNVGTTGPSMQIVTTAGTGATAQFNAATFTGAAGTGIISRLPVKSVELVGTDPAYDYTLGEPVFFDDGGTRALGMVSTAGLGGNGGTARLVQAAGALTPATSDIISVLQYTSIETGITSQPTGTYNVGDVIVYNTNVGTATTTMAVVTAVNSSTNALTVAADGGAAAALTWTSGSIAKIFSARGEGKTMNVQDTEPVLSVSASSPSGTLAAAADQVIGRFDITANGPRDITLATLRLNVDGSFNASNGGTINGFELWHNGSKIADGTNTQPGVAGIQCPSNTVGYVEDTDTGGTNNDCTIQYVDFSPALVITQGTTTEFQIKANTSSVKSLATTNDVTVSLRVDGTAGVRDADNGVTYTYANGKSTPISITTDYLDAYPLTSNTLTY